jgi:hypothetical protein
VHHNGFKEMGLKISKNESTDVLPVAHTCLKELELPVYSSKSIMEQKILFSFNYLFIEWRLMKVRRDYILHESIIFLSLKKKQ